MPVPPCHHEPDMPGTKRAFSKAERAIVGLAAFGAAFMAYLALVHFERGAGSLCDLAPGFSCQVVNQSVYSDILGVPVSLLGLSYFLAVFAVTLGRFRNAFKAIEIFTVGAVIFSLYLTGVELYLLASVCVFCELSKIVMLLILGIAHRSSHREGEAVAGRMHAAAAAVGLAATLAVYFLQH